MNNSWMDWHRPSLLPHIRPFAHSKWSNVLNVLSVYTSAYAWSGGISSRQLSVCSKESNKYKWLKHLFLTPMVAVMCADYEPVVDSTFCASHKRTSNIEIDFYVYTTLHTHTHTHAVYRLPTIISQVYLGARIRMWDGRACVSSMRLDNCLSWTFTFFYLFVFWCYGSGNVRADTNNQTRHIRC